VTTRPDEGHEITPARPRTIDPVARTADDVAALVLAVPGVVRLHSGLFGEATTYLPGRRVAGVAVTAESVDVHVVLDHAVPIRMTAQRIHAVVASAVDVPVHVHVDDVDSAAAPGRTDPEEES
jgi:uncharacterized alkaline shock family protein YloU